MAKPTLRRTRSKQRRPASVRKTAPRQLKAASRAPSASAKRASGKPKWVYRFGNGKAEGRADMRNLLGGKGAGLAEMANLGLPVPPGFTITTEGCTYFYAHDHRYPADLKEQVADALADVETAIGAKFGDPTKPLLVSLRSGARASIPGM